MAHLHFLPPELLLHVCRMSFRSNGFDWVATMGALFSTCSTITAIADVAWAEVAELCIGPIAPLLATVPEFSAKNLQTIVEKARQVRSGSGIFIFRGRQREADTLAQLHSMDAYADHDLDFDSHYGINVIRWRCTQRVGLDYHPAKKGWVGDAVQMIRLPDGVLLRSKTPFSHKP